ncbi:hypothetical protein [Actinomadura sp. GTD37]|uniref:hypothetical protein n=1 Tax=Actinomadura sp. GTD37 TaxID=1778030 RepID=UPI0035BFE575
MDQKYVYIRSEPGLWTVGFYRPDGRFEPESDHGSTEEAAARVALLNGDQAVRVAAVVKRVEELEAEMRAVRGLLDAAKARG